MKTPLKHLIRCLLLTVAGIAHAATYYVDPATGSMSNSGSSGSPWSTLEAVFSAGKTFSSGDVINLRNGFHGAPTVTGHFASGNVTIQPQSGHSPKLKNVIFSASSRWVLSGVSISPLHVGPSSWQDIPLIDISSNSHHITIRDCYMFHADDISTWGQQSSSDFARMAGRGVVCKGPDLLFENNHIQKTNFAMEIHYSAPRAVVRNNLIEDTLTDGIRCLSNDSLYEDNVLRNWYGVHSDSDHHDDGFQSWAPTGGTVSGLTIRRNLIINATEAGRHSPGTSATYRLHGIGFFDGWYEDLRIENNVIIVDNLGHGIAVLGGKNCKIVNNTVVRNPITIVESGGGPQPTQPWITIARNKDTSEAGFGNEIRNNISGQAASTTETPMAPGVVLSNNILTGTSYSNYFVNWNAHDLHLKAGSPAINAGTTTSAPSTDFDGVSRTSPYDIGAYEFALLPAAPSGLAATKQGYAQITLAWIDSATNETEYRIERKKGAGGVYAQIATVGAVGGSGGTGSYVDATAGSGTAYYYRVRAFNAAGNSSYSNEASATTDEVTAGRVAHWKMDETSGTTTADASGNANTGSLGASPANPLRVAGKIGNALSFDGTDDVVNAGSGSSLDNLASFSVAAWIRADSMGEGGKGRIVTKATGTNPTAGWHLHALGTNQLEFRVDYSTAELARVSAFGSISTGAWRHVLVTWTGSATASNVRMYVDGSEVSYSSTTNAGGTRVNDSSSSIYLGNESGGTRTFDGLLDDVRIYNRVLSAVEITAIYRAGL